MDERQLTTVTNERYGFRLAVPTEWGMDQTFPSERARSIADPVVEFRPTETSPGWSGVFFTPEARLAGPGLSISVEARAAENSDVDSFTPLGQQYLLGRSFEVDGTNELQVAGVRAVEIRWHQDSPVVNSTQVIRRSGRIVTLFNGGFMYSLRISGLDEEVARYAAEFDRVLQSFSLTQP